MELEEIQNKVAQSGLVTFNLEELIDTAPQMLIDIKEQLYMGLMLKEKEFRTFIKEHDWSQYKDSNIAITCSTDAIVPTWAFMLVANKLSGIAKNIVFGTLENLQEVLFEARINTIDVTPFIDQRVVVKGCSDQPVPVSAYVSLTAKLTPVVKTLMFGEPCSTVPIYKKG
ncbi:MAG: DUF2480 family protein [bacterium]|nr:DUF2480 family protein [bacterium]